METNILDGHSNPGSETSVENPHTGPKIVCVIKKPRLSLLSSSQTQLGKTRLNHFEHYSEVKPEEEKRRTIGEIANQNNNMQEVSGWKIQHLANQMDQVVCRRNFLNNDFDNHGVCVSAILLSKTHL